MKGSEREGGCCVEAVAGDEREELVCAESFKLSVKKWRRFEAGAGTADAESGWRRPDPTVLVLAAVRLSAPPSTPAPPNPRTAFGVSSLDNRLCSSPSSRSVDEGSGDGARASYDRRPEPCVTGRSIAIVSAE